MAQFEMNIFNVKEKQKYHKSMLNKICVYEQFQRRASVIKEKACTIEP